MVATVTRKSLKKIKDSTNYYPHQVTGIRDLAKVSSFLLADDMGLGKTLQALTVAAIDFERGWATRVLTVTPASLKWNWLDEINEFTNFTAMVLDGTPRQRSQQIAEFMLTRVDILIVNYEQVAAHLEELNAVGFDIVIFDEAHYLKNRSSKRTIACHKLRRTRTFLLTGSPLLNQAHELWSLLHMIDPREYPNFWRFVNRYCVFGGYKNKQIVGVKHVKELETRLKNVMVRRLKRDVLDLPEKQHIVLRVDLHPKQREMYKQAVKELKITVPGGEVEFENPLVKFLYLKQICGTTAAIHAGFGDISSKLDVAIERIKEIIDSGERVVVFTQFRVVQECIVRRLDEEALKSWQLHGDVPKRDRVDVIHAWEKAPPGALVCMLQVAGIGLNMTAASKAIFVDKLFVPKLNEQAEDRLHRIGASTTQPIQIIELIARNTIESRIEAILRQKRKLFDTLVEESDWHKALLDALKDEDADP